MAVRMDASTDALTRTTGLPSITAYTLMMWMQIVVDRNAYSTLFCFGDTSTGNNFWNLSTNADGVTLAVSNGSVEMLGSAFTAGAAGWAHLAHTVSGTGASAGLTYVNGVLAVTSAGNAAITGVNLWVGNNALGEWSNAKYGAIKVYGAALTVGEIKDEMRSYLPVRTANLTSSHPMLLHTDLAQYGATWTANGTLATDQGPPIPWSLRPSLPRLGGAAALGIPGDDEPWLYTFQEVA
jgi:hypothetical protein